MAINVDQISAEFSSIKTKSRALLARPHYRLGLFLGVNAFSFALNDRNIRRHGNVPDCIEMFPVAEGEVYVIEDHKAVTFHPLYLHKDEAVFYPSY